MLSAARREGVAAAFMPAAQESRVQGEICRRGCWRGSVGSIGGVMKAARSAKRQNIGAMPEVAGVER